MVQETFSVIAHIHPFSPSKRDERNFLIDNTILDVINFYGLPHSACRVFIGDEEIQSKDFSFAKPSENDHVILKVVPQGDSGEVRGKTQGWGGLLMLAGFVTFFVNPFVGIGLFVAGASVIGGGAAVAYGMDFYASLDDAKSTESILSIRGGRNRSIYGNPLPVVLGKHLVTPYYGGLPYTEIGGTDGEDQYLNMLFAVGYGPMRISDLKIGETLVTANAAGTRNGSLTGFTTNFDSVEIQVYDDGTIPSLYPYTVTEEQLSILLEAAGSNVRTTEANTTRISVDIYFPQGLVEYDDDGDKNNRTVQVIPYYRLVGGSMWTQLGAFDSGTNTITRAKSKAMRFTCSANVTAGQYEVYIDRVTADTDDTKILDKVYWTALRSIKTTEPPAITPMRSYATDAKPCLVAMKIKATSQLNGVVDQFNCVAESYIPTYDGSGTGSSNWLSGYTSNPASCFLWLLRGPMNPRPIPDARIDWERLEAWYATCSTKGWTCNALITSKMRLRDYLQRVAMTGRAALFSRDGMYSVIIDEAKTSIVQHFTPRNARNFTWQKAFPDLPHALKARFISADDGWDESERVICDDGYTETTAEKYEELDLWGFTDPDVVWKHGRYLIAKTKLRPEVFSWEASVDAVVCEPGDLVVCQHDAPMWGVRGARIKSVTLNGSSEAISIVIDEVVPMESEKSYAIRFRRSSTGESVYALVNTVAGNTSTLTFTTPIAAASVPVAGDLASFGEQGLETARCVITGIETIDDFTLRIYAADEAPAIHTADSGTIPAYDSKITRPAPFIIENVIPVLTPTAVNETTETLSQEALSLARSVSSTAIRYLGAYEAAHPTPRNNMESWLVYDTDAGQAGRPGNGHPERGVYYDNNGTPTRITTASSVTLRAKLPYAMADVAWAESEGYGVAADYGLDAVFAVFGAVQAFISTAFVSQLFAESAIMTGDITSYEGQGVNRRAQKLGSGRLDWLNAPDGGDEQLFARIGRLGVGAVLLDGDFYTHDPLSEWEEPELITALSRFPRYYTDGATLRIAYGNNSYQMRQKVYSSSGWGTEQTISDTPCQYPSWLGTGDSTLHILFCRISDGYLVEMAYDGSWSSESVVNSASTGPTSAIRRKNGEQRVCYRRNSDNYLVERIRSGGVWGSEIVINSFATTTPAYFEDSSGILRVGYSYLGYTYTKEKFFDDDLGTWGNETVISSSASFAPSYIEMLSGEIRVSYTRDSDKYLVEKTDSGSGWGGETVLNETYSSSSSYSLDSDGTVRIAFFSVGGDILERINREYKTISATPERLKTASGLAPSYSARAWVNFDGTTADNLSGTYARSGTTVTVTATAHGHKVGHKVYLDFTSGAATDGLFTVISVIDANTFTVTHGTSGTTSGNVTLNRRLIRASGNVNSVITIGTGVFWINFDISMSSSTYQIIGSAGGSGTSIIFNKEYTNAPTIYGFGITTIVPGAGASNDKATHVVIF